MGETTGELLTAVVAAASDAIFTADRQGVITTWNPAAERLYGYRADEAIGMALTELWPAERCAEYLAYRACIDAGGRVEGRRTLRRHRDGYDVPVLLNIFPVCGEGDEVLGSASSARDLRPEIATGDELAQVQTQRELLGRAVQTAPIALLAYDEGARLTLAEGGGLVDHPVGVPLLGRTAYDVYDAQPDVVRHVRRTLEGADSDTLVTFADRTYRAAYRPLRDAGGDVVGGTIAALEVTGEIEAQRSLLATQSRYEALLRRTFDVILVTDAEATIEDVVFGGGEAFGYTEDEIVGCSSWVFIHPDDVDEVRANWDEALRRSGSRPPLECRLHRADGEWGWGEIVVSNALTDPAVGSMVVNLRDVTTRRRAQEAQAHSELRYRRVVNAAHDAIAVLDADGRVALGNPRLGDLLGCDAEHLVGRSFGGLGLPDPGPRGEASAPTRYERSDGATLWLQAGGAPLGPTGEQGEGEDRLVWVEDVTQRIALQQRLVEAERMEAIGRFAGGVVHDFNNILSAIRVNAELLLGSVPSGSPAREDAQGISDGVDRGAALVQQLLAFAHGQVLRPREVLLEDVVEAAVAFCRRLMPEHVHLLLRSTGPSMPVHVDPDQLERVVVNLVLNARDAVEGCGTVLVEAGVPDHPDVPDSATDPADPAEPRWSLRVSDDGVGMPREVAARCFEPFFTTKAAGTGTGLGLSIAYGVVVQSGGSICVDSTPGVGTRITVSLPRSHGSR